MLIKNGLLNEFGELGKKFYYYHYQLELNKFEDQVEVNYLYWDDVEYPKMVSTIFLLL